MKIKLKDAVVHSAASGISKHHKPGATIEVDDAVGTSLIERGHAVEAKSKGATEDEAADPKKKKNS